MRGRVLPNTRPKLPAPAHLLYNCVCDYSSLAPQLRRIPLERV